MTDYQYLAGYIGDIGWAGILQSIGQTKSDNLIHFILEYVYLAYSDVKRLIKMILSEYKLHKFKRDHYKIDNIGRLISNYLICLKLVPTNRIIEEQFESYRIGKKEDNLKKEYLLTILSGIIILIDEILNASILDFKIEYDGITYELILQTGNNNEEIEILSYDVKIKQENNPIKMFDYFNETQMEKILKFDKEDLQKIVMLKEKMKMKQSEKHDKKKEKEKEMEMKLINDNKELNDEIIELKDENLKLNDNIQLINKVNKEMKKKQKQFQKIQKQNINEIEKYKEETEEMMYTIQKQTDLIIKMRICEYKEIIQDYHCA